MWWKSRNLVYSRMGGEESKGEGGAKDGGEERESPHAPVGAYLHT